MSDHQHRRHLGLHMSYGQIAYEAYCKNSGGVSPISGAQLPTWKDLRVEIQSAWIEAGNAAAESDKRVSGDDRRRDPSQADAYAMDPTWSA